MQLAIPLSKKDKPLFRQVYLGLRQAILSGAFPAGDRLPSTRDLSEQLGISRTVVLLAYDHLLADGFIVGRGGSGTYVSESFNGGGAKRPERSAQLLLSRFGVAAARAAGAMDFPSRQSPPLRYDFAYNRSDMAIFPFEKWRRSRGAVAHKTRFGRRGHCPRGSTRRGCLRDIAILPDGASAARASARLLPYA
jgi:GntR family transcriptional regulator/MocR family aminotransferase